RQRTPARRQSGTRRRISPTRARVFDGFVACMLGSGVRAPAGPLGPPRTGDALEDVQDPPAHLLPVEGVGDRAPARDALALIALQGLADGGGERVDAVVLGHDHVGPMLAGAIGA